MPSCVVKNCRNHSGYIKKSQGITFHKFPSANDVWKNDWVQIIRDCRNDNNWTPSKSSVICSKHFEENDLYTTKGGLLRVVAWAVPKKFLFETSSIQEEQSAEANTSSAVHRSSLVIEAAVASGSGQQKELETTLSQNVTTLLQNNEEAVKDTVNYTECRMPEEKGRYPEICRLREELIRAKSAADEEKFQREKYETKLKDLELKLNSLCSAEIVADKKDHRKISDEEVNAMKTQIRDMKEEMEEMRITVVEKTEQLQEYRVKHFDVNGLLRKVVPQETQQYLQAQQQVEELRRQLDIIEYDNKQVSDQIQIEIQKMKMQFQEKLQELAPLPDLLKGAQMQLQEAKQMQRLAEDSSAQLANELHRVKEKLVVAVNNLNQEKADRTKLYEENKLLNTALEEKQREIDELTKNWDDSKCQVLRLQEKLSQLDLRFQEKSAECMQVLKDLDELRTESSRSLSRYKDRADSMRRYLQTQISEMERQLIQSRAQCRACQKERDEIRQRMQIQINSLQENFELVEIRLRALQNQVSSLKSSYTVILADEDDTNNEFSKIATTSSN